MSGADPCEALQGELAASRAELAEARREQAATAVENTRLLGEVQGRKRDVEQSRERQTATSEILKVIAASTSNVQPVFDAIVANAKRLLQVGHVISFRYVDGVAHLVAATPVR